MPEPFIVAALHAKPGKESDRAKQQAAWLDD
jgi:hypothetical protein